MEDGGGETGQVILSGVELIRLPRVGEGFGVQFVVAKYLFELGAVEGTVGGGVDGVARRGWGLGHWGG